MGGLTERLRCDEHGCSGGKTHSRCFLPFEDLMEWSGEQSHGVSASDGHGQDVTFNGDYLEISSRRRDDEMSGVLTHPQRRPGRSF